MRFAFYDDLTYRLRQAETTRRLWEAGKYRQLAKPLETRVCKNPRCSLSFQVKPRDPKAYCGHSCAASVSNLGRVQSEETRFKISLLLRQKPSSLKGAILKPRKKLVCQNPSCRKSFEVLPYLAATRKFCSVACAIRTIGRQTTSPKAAKSKPGVRYDIDKNICFFSTWEANIARVFNLLQVKWEYAPRVFDLGLHTYRPDFYLQEDDKFVEVKNFMNYYSRKRDKLFRQKFSHVRLEVISKKTYKQIEKHYRPLIDCWE